MKLLQLRRKAAKPVLIARLYLMSFYLPANFVRLPAQYFIFAI